jgi:hypothetical protein
MRELTVTKVIRDGDRILLYGHPKRDGYHIIAGIDVDVKVGDTVKYNPIGVNFGRFEGVIDEQGKG